MVKSEIEKKGCSTRQWLWLVMALVAVFVAMAMSSKTSPKALFGAIDRACPCARVISLSNPHFKFLYFFCTELWNSESGCVIQFYSVLIH